MGKILVQSFRVNLFHFWKLAWRMTDKRFSKFVFSHEIAWGFYSELVSVWAYIIAQLPTDLSFHWSHCSKFSMSSLFARMITEVVKLTSARLINHLFYRYAVMRCLRFQNLRFFSKVFSRSIQYFKILFRQSIILRLFIK